MTPMNPIITTRMTGPLRTLSAHDDENHAVEHNAAKSLLVGGLAYMTLPVARVPAGIASADWDRIARINDEILDHVSYDYSRANSPKSGGVQPPDVTWRRGLGVCMDYAALFEQRARNAGYTVRSMHSDTLAHAWNQIMLGGLWWIVDVTWNGGDVFASGQPIPSRVRIDPDFRRRYLLTTVDNELDLCRRGLLPHTHQCPDARPIDYEKTLEAMGVINQINPLIAQRNSLVSRRPQPHADIAEMDRRIEQLHEQYRRLAAMYPLGVSFGLGS